MAVNLFLFPHTIRVTRPEAPTAVVPTAVGKQPYQGVRADTEAPTLFEVPASIQYSATGRAKGADLPSDTPSLTVWRIMTPRGLLERNAITERDVVIDELGRRFQVNAAYWTSLGYSMRATLLQA
jgi:hypothetical protein